jgi:FtsZ-interacting cell division protein ZipA
MARAARQLAAAGGGRVVDDNGTELDERALRAIETELAAVAARLAHAGIEPGSGLALRLFS